METIFFVFRCYRYRESKKWEYQLVKMCTTLPEAQQCYHDNGSRIIKDSNDFAMCMIFDNFGNRVEVDTCDTHTEETSEE